VPGNEKADVLAGKEAEKVTSSSLVSMTSLKLQITERYVPAHSSTNLIDQLYGPLTNGLGLRLGQPIAICQPTHQQNSLISLRLSQPSHKHRDFAVAKIQIVI
jgi:hypothetical protein